MNEIFATMVMAAVISVALGVFLRQRGWGIAIPLLAVGALVGIAPVGPDAPPDPEVILIAVLAPLVFGEALGSSYLDLRKVSRPVLALAIGLVVATTLVVGVVATMVVAMPIAMAFALGAVLAPTDAVAVSTVARRAGLPRRLVSILEGESLVNDGTGLTALKVSLVAAAAGAVSLLEVGRIFSVAVVVGVGVGAVGGILLSWVLRRSKDLVPANALILVAPFGLYLLAEAWQGSGILAVVVAALVIANRQNSDPGHVGRVQSVNLWKHITFVLQCLAFFLIGLELPEVLDRVSENDMGALLVLVPAVLVTLIVLRTVFVFGMIGVVRVARKGGTDVLRGALIVSWAGARGPVSGLGAFSIPVVFASGVDVPYRDLILATTFLVIVITLLLSLTLAPLARAIKVSSDDDGELLQRVDVRLARAALDRLSTIEVEAMDSGTPLPAEVSERLREDAERRLDAPMDVDSASMTREIRVQQMIEAARAMIRAEQEELLTMRDDEGLPDALVRPILRRLDMRDQALRTEQR
ncbi:MAG: cation:proton antiporter [Actinomycetota bacterium]|nr:cation:proton antiporter [Actinomycetota bacterium]